MLCAMGVCFFAIEETVLDHFNAAAQMWMLERILPLLVEVGFQWMMSTGSTTSG